MTIWIGYHISESDPKCWDCLLKPWWKITCISPIVERKSRNKFKRNYLKNKKQFPGFLLHFSNLHDILHFYKKYISLIPQIFGKFLTPKIVLTWMEKSSCFRTPSASQRVHGSLTLPKYAQHHFCPKFSLIYDNLNRI